MSEDVKDDTSKSPIQQTKDFLSLAPEAAIETFAFPISFALTRISIKFSYGESKTSRVLHGLLLSAVAGVVELMVKESQLSSYIWSYSPLIITYYASGSVSSDNRYPNKNIVFIAGTAAILAFNFGYGKYLRTAVPIYSISRIAKLPRETATSFVVLSVLEGFVTSSRYNTETHYLTHSLIGYEVALQIRRTYLPLDRNSGLFMGAIGIVAGLIATTYEEEIKEYFIPRKTFHSSYMILRALISDKEKFDSTLERALIVSTNLYVATGVFHIYLLDYEQQRNLLYQNARDPKSLKVLYDFASKAIFVASVFASSRVISDAINRYISKQITHQVRQDFLHNEVLNKTTFNRIVTYTNHSIGDYLNNIEIVASESQKMLGDIQYSLPKLMFISEVLALPVWQLPTLALLDSLACAGFGYVENLKQSYIAASRLCATRLEKTSMNDFTNAASAMQADYLNLLNSTWSELHQCQHSNDLKASVLQSLSFFQDNYIWIQYTSYQLMIASLNDKIEPGRKFALARALTHITNTILFKAKHQTNLETVENSLNKLREFNKITDSSKPIAKNVNLLSGGSGNLEIIDFHFVRHNDITSLKISIDFLSLEGVKKYVVTGDNGSGKTSTLLILYYLINGIVDDSYSEISGNITHQNLSPNSSVNIKIIPQHSYCPMYKSLFDIMAYSTTTSASRTHESALTTEEMMMDMMRKLHFDQIGSIETKIQDVKDNWCNYLSGGQIIKLFLINALITCPDVLILDETLSSLDSGARAVFYNLVKESECLSKSLIIIVSHDEQNMHSQCINGNFYDHELHFANGTVSVSGLPLCDTDISN